MSLPALAVHQCWRLATAPAARRFARAMKDPEPVQRAILAGILRDNSETEFGRAHGFGGIGGVERFQAAVPIREYRDFAGWLGAAAAGRPDVLTPGRPLALLPTSGTHAGAKLIPWTAALKREFNAALGPWVHGFMRSVPGAWRGAAYWSLSPPTWPEDRTPGGIAIGFESDTAYLPTVLRPLLDKVFAVPAGVAKLRDPETWRYATLLHLLATADLTMISVWSPTFLTALLEPLAGWWPALVSDLEHGTFMPPFEGGTVLLPGLRLRGNPRRARQLGGVFRDGGRPAFARIWPRLAAISCWTDAASRAPAGRLSAMFPQAVMVPKGLLATEGVVSIPWPEAVSPTLAVTSHFYEFEDGGGAVHPAWDLRDGQCYAVLLTTGGGLYRYRLHDRVRVAGHHERCPMLEFIGREGVTSDLCGEKLAEPFVRVTLERVASGHGWEWGFSMLAPSGAVERPGYTLFVSCESPLDAVVVARELDAGLCGNGHYAHARRIGQLAPTEVALLPGDADWAWSRFQAEKARQGRRIGEIKPTALDAGSGWGEVFGCESMGILNRGCAPN